MRVRAVIRAPDGREVELGHGDMIGRLASCALSLDDGRVSEAHALVSLRGDSLLLLALRGRFAVDGRPLTQVRLEPGQCLDLADGLMLEVLEVVLPEVVMAIEFGGAPPQVLLGTTSLRVRPEPALRTGWNAEANGWIWSSEGGWRLQLSGSSEVRSLSEGDELSIEGCSLRAVAVPLVDAATPKTQLEGAIQAPLKIVARFQSVHLFRGREEALVLDGAAAQILSELVAFGGPVSWQVAAREIWTDGANEVLLRGRWDASLSRMRSRLRAAGIRPDLVRSDRHGYVELVLNEGDEAVDET